MHWIPACERGVRGQMRILDGGRVDGGFVTDDVGVIGMIVIVVIVLFGDVMCVMGVLVDLMGVVLGASNDVLLILMERGVILGVRNDVVILVATERVARGIPGATRVVSWTVVQVGRGAVPMRGGVIDVVHVVLVIDVVHAARDDV